MSEATELVGLLAEEDRLRVVAALALGHRTVGEIGAAAGLDARSVGRALSRLQAGGLVTADGDRLRLQADRFTEVARQAAPPPASEQPGDGGTDAVLRAFLRDGRLVQIPASHGKRLVVLDYLSRLFEPGVRYPEAEVNTLLRAFHPDVAALRRYLVDAQFLSRADGLYWRSGGTVEV